jgi:hypothetical protein
MVNKRKRISQALVTHTCDPSYSGGRDLEDLGLKPAQANSSRDPISRKHPSPKKGGGVGGVSPEFKPQHCKKKENSRKGQKKSHVFTAYHNMSSFDTTT